MPPGGGILLSAHVPWRDDDVAIVATALGVAAVDAIGEADVVVSLKWPNDILLPDGRKVAGLLGERVVADGHIGVVIGMGLNVSWPTADAGLPMAACLNEVAPERIDRSVLVGAILSRFDRELSRVEQFGATAVLDRYRARSGTLGQQVRVVMPDGDVHGRAVDIDTHGRLLVETDADVLTIDVGDVVHLRSQ
jgi:BirA family biotin operon repressor/biotin-[acetyl-CoA-carboxylase] ligase